MSHRTIDIVGGGPAGLSAARLIKLNDPDAAVTVYERASSNTSTFGFGVGLTGATMKNLTAADPHVAERIREASYAGHRLTLRGSEGDVELHGARNLAIGRATLLEILADAARDIGVRLHMGTRYEMTESSADVIVAADGANSDVRGKLETEMGFSVEHGRLHFMWCGVDFATDAAFFTSKGYGDAQFVAHAYPYAPDRSTFLIEADEVTWEAAGLAANDATVEKGGTDEKSIVMLEDVFAEDLRGRRLLTNRTRWARFPTVSLERWHVGNVVLIGDAAHTAHYTIGSGTKLAIEDGIALAEALAGNCDVTAAFAAYEEARRPSVERFKLLAARSQTWWETYRNRSDRLPEEIALSYMTRAGNLTIADYAREYPENAHTALGHLGEAPVSEPERLDEWVLSRPVSGAVVQAETREVHKPPVGPGVRTVTWADRNPTSVAADRLVEEMAADAGRCATVITGPNDPADVGARLDLAERLRVDPSQPVIVEVPVALRPMAAAAVAAHRCDVVVTTA